MRIILFTTLASPSLLFPHFPPHFTNLRLVMEGLRCISAYLDWSNPLDVSWLKGTSNSEGSMPGGVREERALGCHFVVGHQKIPCTENTKDSHHAFLYPTEGSALYLLSCNAPVSHRYTLRHFVADYPNGAHVVGWYYDRHDDIAQSAMDQNDIEIYFKDTCFNMSRPALHARKENGHFIRGPVWLACIARGESAPSQPQWNSVPTSILHGFGWYVPSWIFYPQCRAQVAHYNPYPLPDEGQRRRRSQQQRRVTFEKAIQRPSEQKTRETKTRDTQKNYIHIEPRPEKSNLFHRRMPESQLEEVKTYWRREAERMHSISAQRLVNPSDQSNKSMPTYTDFTLNNRLA